MFEVNGPSGEEAVAAAAAALLQMLRVLVKHGYEPAPPEQGDRPCGWWEILRAGTGGETSHRDEGASTQLSQALPETDLDAIMVRDSNTVRRFGGISSFNGKRAISGRECREMKLADITEMFGYSSDDMTRQQLARNGIYETTDR